MPTTLDLHIKPKDKDAYHLELFERNSSQPLAEASFDYDLSFMTEYEIRRLDADSKDPSSRFERMKAFGQKLYAKVFTSQVQEVWREYKEKGDFLSLCLRIAPGAVGLEALPWEALHDGKEFLCAGARTSLFRLPLDIPAIDDLPPVSRPLDMLAFISSPLDLGENERLQMEREQEILLQAVNTPAGRGKLNLEFEDEAKLPILEQGLEGGCQILHYAGHGISPEDGGGLLLEDDYGKKRPVPVTELLQSLEKGIQDLRLVVISGCQTAKTLCVEGFSDLARGLARQKVPSVIAMQFSIMDHSGLKQYLLLPLHFQAFVFTQIQRT